MARIIFTVLTEETVEQEVFRANVYVWADRQSPFIGAKVMEFWESKEDLKTLQGPGISPCATYNVMVYVHDTYHDWCYRCLIGDIERWGFLLTCTRTSDILDRFPGLPDAEV